MINFRSARSYTALLALALSYGLGTSTALADNLSALVDFSHSSSLSRPVVVVAGIEKSARGQDDDSEDSKKVKAAKKKAEKVKAKLAKLEAKQNNLKDKLAKGQITQAEFDKKNGKLAVKIDKVEELVEVAIAKVALVKAEDELKKAEKALEKAQEAGDQDAINAAEQRIADAREDLEDAQEDFNDAKEDGPKQSPTNRG
ncbi:MAG: hypothetical protein FJ147_14515 [Deltaproteobacteria bacterium]|nr:hypothetical protein [Deltaproteobacteria bacterium]